jgi:hypothetical protein
MKSEQVKDILSTRGCVLDEEKEIQYGVQLKFSNGSIVNAFDKGTVKAQGKDVD